MLEQRLWSGSGRQGCPRAWQVSVVVNIEPSQAIGGVLVGERKTVTPRNEAALYSVSQGCHGSVPQLSAETKCIPHERQSKSRRSAITQTLLLSCVLRVAFMQTQKHEITSRGRAACTILTSALVLPVLVAYPACGLLCVLCRWCAWISV